MATFIEDKGKAAKDKVLREVAQTMQSPSTFIYAAGFNGDKMESITLVRHNMELPKLVAATVAMLAAIYKKEDGDLRKLSATLQAIAALVPQAGEEAGGEK